MNDNFASGTWIVKSGKEDEFTARWREFLEWTAAEAPGLVSAMLVRDADDPRHYVSLAEWKSLDSIMSWRSLPDFGAKLGTCRALCDDFRGSNFTRVVTVVPA